MFTLEEYIEDSLDEVLESSGTTDCYLELGKLIDSRVAKIRASLPEEMQLELNEVLDMIDRQHSDFVSMIYRAGIMNGLGAGLKK